VPIVDAVLAPAPKSGHVKKREASTIVVRRREKGGCADPAVPLRTVHNYRA